MYFNFWLTWRLDSAACWNLRLLESWRLTALRLCQDSKLPSLLEPGGCFKFQQMPLQPSMPQLQKKIWAISQSPLLRFHNYNLYQSMIATCRVWGEESRQININTGYWNIKKNHHSLQVYRMTELWLAQVSSLNIDYLIKIPSFIHSSFSLIFCHCHGFW